MIYKVDGYNLVPYLTGQTAKDPRESFLYINDDQQWRRAGRQPRPVHAGHPHPPQGDEGRVLSLRAQLLQTLSPGRAHGPAD
jgi:hypothetical protein